MMSCSSSGPSGEVDVTVLGLVGGAPGGETPRVADSSAAGAGRFFHNSVPPSVLQPGASVIDTLANSKIRLDSVKRMTQIQNTS